MKKLMVKPGDKILIIAPHPDDESIACGGILCAWGGQCDVCLCTDGSRCVSQEPPHVVKRMRRKEFEAAMDFCNVGKRIRLNITDGSVNKEKGMFRGIDLSQYDIIFVPQKGDGHIDHRSTYKKFITSLRKYHKKLKNKALILQYEVWTPLKDPTHFVDISANIEKKKDLIENYKSQLKNLPYVQLALGLNAYRGAYLNLAYAECYEEVHQKFGILCKKGGKA